MDGWVELNITGKDWMLAREIALKRIDHNRAHNLNSVFQSNELNDKIIGVIGELKFGEFIGIESNLQTDDPWSLDFRIHGNVVVDVKTDENDRHPSHSPDSYTFLVNKAQSDRHKEVFYYVSVMVFMNTAWICGYVTLTELWKYPIVNKGYGLDYAVPYLKLHKPRELLHIETTELDKLLE
jgi:hypothetical protein